MSSLHKNTQRNVRFTADQAAKVARAARVLSRQRGELIEDGAFIRMAALRVADEVLAPTTAEAA